MNRVCVFTGSSPGARPEYADLARRLGRELAARRLELVFGGGRVGLMGVMADALLEAGGRAVGVIPEAMVERELAHEGVTEMRVVATMHERKAQMASLSDAFIAMPGGVGTLDELFETFTWAQLGLHAKPFGLLDPNGYYRDLIGFLDHAVSEGFVRGDHRELLLVDEDPAALLDRIAGFVPSPRIGKLERGEEGNP